MSLYNNSSSFTFSRPPEAVDEFAAALESVRGGTSINPRVEQLKRNYIMQEAMQKNDANKAFDFLQDYMQTRLKLPARLLSPEMDSLFKLMLEEQDSVPSFSVDPSKLDLREYRRPGPSYPGEHLDRDNFLKINPRSPLSSVVTDEVVAIAPTATLGRVQVPRWRQILESSSPSYSDVPLPPSRFGPLKDGFTDLFNRKPDFNVPVPRSLSL